MYMCFCSFSPFVGVAQSYTHWKRVCESYKVLTMSQLKSEVASQLDLSVIRYSRVLEDHRVLSHAFNIAPDQDTVLSITSSGDNVLNLLLERPKKIVAIDMSHAQTSILELKLAAIRQLSYHDFLVLIGEVAATGDEREAVFQAMKHRLPPQAKVFWEGRVDTIREGVAMSGRLQKYLIKIMRDQLSEAVGDQIMDSLVNAQSVEEQRKIFQSIQDKVEAILRATCDKNRLLKGRSAAQQKYLSDISQDFIADVCLTEFNRVSSEVSLTDNFYFNWFCVGERGYNPESRPEFAPPYLREENFQALRGLVDRVDVHTTSLEDYLSLPDIPLFNKINLSDIFEYMSVENTERFFSVLSDNMAVGARVVYWQLFLHRQPQKCPSLQYLSQLSKELHKKDRVPFYPEVYVYEKTN